jgi:ABC-type transport system involved in cytochrome c biogenesis ATPase subunit
VSWLRAALSGAALVLLTFVLLVYVPDLLISQLSAGRGVKVALATTWFSVAVVGLMWALRRLQARSLR